MSSKLILKPLWSNGSCTYAATFKKMSAEDRREVEELADAAGYTRIEDIWTPPSKAAVMSEFFAKMRQAGFELEFDNPDDAAGNWKGLIGSSCVICQDGRQCRQRGGWTGTTSISVPGEAIGGLNLVATNSRPARRVGGTRNLGHQ